MNSPKVPDTYYIFKNMCLNVLYGKLPSYAYFDEGSKEEDVSYWNDYTEEECEQFCSHFDIQKIGSHKESLMKFINENY